MFWNGERAVGFRFRGVEAGLRGKEVLGGGAGTRVQSSGFRGGAREAEEGAHTRLPKIC